MIVISISVSKCPISLIFDLLRASNINQNQELFCCVQLWIIQVRTKCFFGARIINERNVQFAMTLTAYCMRSNMLDILLHNPALSSVSRNCGIWINMILQSLFVLIILDSINITSGNLFYYIPQLVIRIEMPLIDRSQVLIWSSNHSARIAKILTGLK